MNTLTAEPRAANAIWRRTAAALVLAVPAIAFAQVAEIEFQPSTVFVRAGQSHALRVGLKPAHYGVRDLEWSAQDESVARVDGGGVLTAMRAGRTNVYARGGVDGEANEMGRVIVFDDSNSARLEAANATLAPSLKVVTDPTAESGKVVAWPRDGSDGPATLIFAVTQPGDDIVALVCRIQTDPSVQPVLKVQMDDGPELEVRAAGAAGRWQDVSPMFMHPFGGFYRFGLTAGRHTLKLTPLARGLRLDEVRLVGDTGASDRYVSHESTVMGERRWYRVFLPPDYDATRDRLPVIYYLHGWGGRVFKEGVPGSHIDLADVERRVKRDRVIFVMADGQVFWEGGTQFSRFAPYNIFLPHESPFLWEDYFAEFVRQIDATYRTIPDRSQRAVLGFSMGGLMAYRIAERLPQLVGAINPFCGATEAFFGTPAGDTYVRIADMVENLHGVRLRIHDTASDYLKPGNDAVWHATQREQLADTEYAVFPGAHAVDPAGRTQGFNQAFDWAVDGFRHPRPPPARWHAMEFIPAFDVWDYHVTCTPAELGLTELHGVTRGGFRVATLSSLPDGPARTGVRVSVETAPVYLPGSDYEVFDFNEADSSAKRTVVRTDAAGRIKIIVDGGPHQIGIHRAGDPAEVVAVGGLAGQNRLMPVGRQSALTVRLLNRGAREVRGVRGFVAAAEPGVKVLQPDFSVPSIGPGEVVTVVVPVLAQVEPPKFCAPFALRFEIKVVSAAGESWPDEMDVVPFYDVTKVDVTVVGDDRRKMGGAAEVKAAPGEAIALRANGHLLRVFPDDPYLVKVADIPLIKPDDPENGAAYSALRIAPDCPPGHVVKCLVRAETVVNELRSVSLDWGWAEFEVR